MMKLSSDVKNLIQTNYNEMCETDNKRILATLNAIQQLPVIERNTIMAYLFACDCKPSNLGKLLNTSTQYAAKIVRQINKKLQDDPTLDESNFPTDDIVFPY